MRSKLVLALAAAVSLPTVCDVAAQDIGPNFHKITDGVYVYYGNARNDVDTEHDSNAGIIITNDGVFLVDTGQSATDSRKIQAALKKLTSQPVKYIVFTEPHPDHIIGSWLFSPPATIITHAPGIASMKADAARVSEGPMKLMVSGTPEQRAALEGYHHVVAQREFPGDKETMQVGERTIVLLYHKNVHSEADISVWLPKERIVFSGAAALVDQFNVFRPFVSIPDTLVALKELKALNPEYVIPSHGASGIPATVRLFDEMERYYKLLLERVGKMVKDGKSLEQIQKELRMPEFDHWGSKSRFAPGVEAAYKVVKGIPTPAFRVGDPCSYRAPPCEYK